MEFKRIDGGVCAPRDFLASGVAAGLKVSGKPDMAMIFSGRPAVWAGGFTSCRFRAAPVSLCEERMKAGGPIRGIIVNSGNANACTGETGLENARKMAALAAGVLDVDEAGMLVASTGRIGVQLPMNTIAAGIAAAARALSNTGGGDAAQAIMTTDTRPKELAFELEIGGRAVRVGGMAKGAGMIAPGMNVPHATMLAFINTDAVVDRVWLRDILAEGVEKTFNRITIDGDMSTNDTVILMANGAAGAEVVPGTPEADKMKAALIKIMEHLAKEMVRDGEGATKFITIEVNGAKDDDDAVKCAKAVAESLLCKTAWFGGDPNWGRVLAAAGRSGADFEPEDFALDYDDVPVVRRGAPVDRPETELAAVLAGKKFKVGISLGGGDGAATVWTNDVSYEYVKINAEYHT